MVIKIMVRKIRIEVDRIGKLVTVIAIGVINNTTNGFDKSKLTSLYP